MQKFPLKKKKKTKEKTLKSARQEAVTIDDSDVRSQQKKETQVENFLALFPFWPPFRFKFGQLPTRVDRWRCKRPLVAD